jgi:hypothetical protein
MMRRKAIVWAAALAAGSLFLAGCEESASPQHAKAHVPAPVPVPDTTYATTQLPLSPIPSFESLTDRRPRIDVLVEQVQARVNSARKEYKAGEFDKAHADYNTAIAMVQISGFPPDGDSRLTDLLDQIGEALHSYDVNAEQESADTADETADENGDQAGANAPSNPLDQFASMTLPPGDPRLAARAEQEIMRVPHDLPLTVNDSVLQYLSYFSSQEK